MFRSMLNAFAILTLCLLGCRRSGIAEDTGVTKAELPSAALSASPQLEPYPRAAWRLANPAELDPVVLWVSQILVRYAGARDEVSFNLAYWSSVPPSTRSREEALRLAAEVAERAGREPAHFAELARQYSEDLPSRQEGGALGGLSAAELASWPQVLDALAALQPGQTSRVVESPYGFHVFFRSAPPPEQLRSGSHIVIGHERAPWLAMFARGALPERSREQALELSTQVYRLARAEPARFAELVQQYSEHRDAVDDGDFGAWSTREPSAFPPRMRRLAELESGEVGAPIETHLGFEIVLRTPERPRQHFRARVLPFPLDTNATSAPRVAAPEQRAAAFASAGALIERLARDPAHWDELATGVFDWEEGRGVAGLSSLLAGVRLGQFAPAAIDSEYGILVTERLASVPAAAQAFRTELPAPAQPDLEHFVGSLSSADCAAFLEVLAERAQSELGLSEALAERLRELHRVGTSWEQYDSPEARWGALQQLLEATRQLLGDVPYARYLAELQHGIRTVLLEPAAGAPPERGF